MRASDESKVPDERKVPDADQETTSLDELMSSICDTAKILGYLGTKEVAAWQELLTVVAASNASNPHVAAHGVSLFFYCSDLDQVYALHHAPHKPSTLFLRTSTVSCEHPCEAEDAVARWRAAKLWTEPTQEELDDGCVRGGVDTVRVKANLERDPSFGAPTGHLWLQLMQHPPVPEGLPMSIAKKMGMLWPLWTPAPSEADSRDRVVAPDGSNRS